MLKRLLILLLALVTLPVFANTKNEFKNLMDELHYDVTVEWDQKDESFIKDRITQFEKDYTKLLLAGLTPTEVYEVLAQSSISQATLERLKFLAQLNKFSSSTDVVQFLREHQSSFYERGASWNGEVFIYAGFILVAAAVITAIALVLIDVSNDSYVCTERSTVETCSWITDSCMSYDEYGSCVSYHTPYQQCGYACLSGYWED